MKVEHFKLILIILTVIALSGLAIAVTVSPLQGVLMILLSMGAGGVLLIYDIIMPMYEIIKPQEQSTGECSGAQPHER